MSRTHRLFVITLVTFALAAVAVSGYWGVRSIFAAKTTSPSAKVSTAPLNAITSFDAAVIARHIVHTNPFSNVNQFCAGDVTGNGAISSNDGAIVARYVSGLTGTVMTGTIVSPPCHANYPTTIPVLKGDTS